MPPVAPVLSVSDTAFWMVAETLSVGATVATPAACVAANDVEAIVNRVTRMARVVRFMSFLLMFVPDCHSTPLPARIRKNWFVMTAVDANPTRKLVQFGN